MADPAKSIELPADLQAFAEEEVRSGQSASVGDVVRRALEDHRQTKLRSAIVAGIAELDAGLGVTCTPDEFIDVNELRAAVGSYERIVRSLLGS